MARVTAMSSGEGVGSPLGWLWTTIRRGGIAPDGRFEDLPHFDLGGVHRAVIYTVDTQHVVARVEQDDAQVLLLQCGHFILHQCRRVRRAVDSGTLLRRFEPQSVSQFNGRLELGCLRLADAVLVTQFMERRSVQTGETVELEQQPLPHLNGILAGNADT